MHLGAQMARPSRRLLVMGASVAAFAGAMAQGAQAQAVPPVVPSLNGQHPSAYYTSAMELFRRGDRDNAVFVFYLGQLRYRTHLMARPDLPRQQDPALFGSLTETIGRPINEYAFGNVEKLDQIMQAVIVYDRANPDKFTPPQEFEQAHTRVRIGMERLRQTLPQQAEELRAQRRTNGLENR